MNEEIKLTWKGRLQNRENLIFVGKVSEVYNIEGDIQILLKGRDLSSNNFSEITLSSKDLDFGQNGLSNVPGLNHIKLGDILMCKDRNIRSIYRPYSSNNIVFATVRCNSNCLMCSQPPIDIDDTLENFNIWNYAIELIDDDLQHITFTGGEPTLLGYKLVELLNKFLDRFKKMVITILTNGRTFSREKSMDMMADVIDPGRVVLAIPLYSDIYKQHDHIVQAKDAFYQTTLGIQKISNLGFPIEIRIVLHKLSNPRLVHLSKYIHKNFPFVYHVTFMGLEIIGYTKANKDQLIDNDINTLREALFFLSSWQYNVSIYNTALCHLPRELWKYAKKSISDWKNSFPAECDDCQIRESCCGFFSWNLKYAEVSPVRSE